MNEIGLKKIEKTEKEEALYDRPVKIPAAERQNSEVSDEEASTSKTNHFSWR